MFCFPFTAIHFFNEDEAGSLRLPSNLVGLQFNEDEAGSLRLPSNLVGLHEYTKKSGPSHCDEPLHSWVPSGTRTHDIQNHNLTL